MIDINKIYEGDALTVLKTFPDAFVDCICTSPPYWALRRYSDSEKELGKEPKFEDYILWLIEIFNECKRVLKPEGTCFVNLGDTYAGNGGWNNFKDTWKPTKQIKNQTVNIEYSKLRNESVPNKCLCMIPERFAISMIDNGWILRNKIIWHKPNQMPSSATDRFTVDFEDVMFFVKQGNYYFEQQFEPYTTPLDRWAGQMIRGDYKTKTDQFSVQGRVGRDMRPNEQGRNMRTVWSINTEPSHEEHYAMYPQALVERILKAGCPENGLVLDPFAGMNTTGLVALKMNRNFIGIELNKKSIKDSDKRLFNEIGLFL